MDYGTLEWLTEPVIGTRVRARRAGPDWVATSEGVYHGVVRSDWDGEPEHFFTDGHINGIDQTCFGFPAPGAAITTQETPDEILRSQRIRS